MSMIRVLEEKIACLQKDVEELRASNIQRDVQITNLMTTITNLLRSSPKERVTFATMKCKEDEISRVMGGLKPNP